MPTPEDRQREAARVLLDAIGGRGFVLAGSSAIREHGIIQRPTADVDLFTVDIGPDAFNAALDAGRSALRAHGYDVVAVRRAEQYARLAITTAEGHHFDVDMGVDWRAHDPVTLAIGPVLDIEDAIANKVGALYGRGEARDYLDVDAIRRSGRITDEGLIETAAKHDPGFAIGMFVRQLAQVDRLRPEDVVEYGYTAQDLAGVKRRLQAWVEYLRGKQGSGPSVLGAVATRPPGRGVVVRQAHRPRRAPSRGDGLQR